MGCICIYKKKKRGGDDGNSIGLGSLVRTWCFTFFQEPVPVFYGLLATGRQLGFPWAEVQVCWIGIQGLLWSRLDRAPNILVIHAGGNDLGVRTT